ncbi:MAG: hypothetical protein ACJA1C_003421 [Crocinitomicaceae bacterium]|jgi:hypothetical protein
MKKTVQHIDEIGVFHMVDHSTTHNQILYRSHNIDTKENTDILFSGVTYSELPLKLSSCKIKIGGAQEFIYLRGKTELPLNRKVFVVEQKEFNHLVVADNVLIQTNDFEYHETSIPIKREAPLTTEEIQEMATAIETQTKERGTQWVLENIVQNTGNWYVLENEGL